jgi:hypothetical protein
MIDIRKQLLDTRAARVKIEQELRTTAAQLKQLEQSLAELQRVGRTPGDDREAEELLARVRRLRTQTEQTQGRYNEGARAVSAATELYGRFLLEERDELQDMDANCPFLLLPLRLETRFMTTPRGAPQLWVRIYPDDLAIETHETPLTVDERAAGEAYWRSSWGADEVAQKKAWAALVAASGPARAAWIAHALTPTNAPPDEPAFSATELRGATWSQPARVRVMPDRLVVMTYSGGERVHTQAGKVIPDPLIVGPDPAGKNLIPKDGKLEFPDELAWLVDFEAAVNIGMGVKIDLTPAQARGGFDRVVVLGVRRTNDKLEAVERLRALFDSHHYTDGLSLITQGTPTNNTDAAPAGRPAADAATDESWRVERGEPLFKPDTGANRPSQPDLAVQKDGQRLAEALGLPYATFQHVRHADNSDALEARAMNGAAYPGTLGYYAQEFLSPPIENRNKIYDLRRFMVDYVSGRGPLPAFRAGQQPYGVLPTTAVSRIEWYSRQQFLDAPPVFRLLPTILEQLNILRRTWTDLSRRVSRVGFGNDPDQTLLDILALHPAPAELYMRHAATATYSRNYLIFNAMDDSVLPAEEKRIARARDILTKLGMLDLLPTRIMSLLWFAGASPLDGPTVEEGVLSETKPLKQTIPQGNYINWIAQSDIATLRDENFGIDEQGRPRPAPRALLYLLLNYAMQRALIDAGNNVRESEGLSIYAQEAHFLNIREPEERTVWHQFAEPARVSQGLPLGLYLQTTAGLGLPDLKETHASLSLLSTLSTARLERLLAEHLALCSYRLDAWYTGLVYYQLVNSIIPRRAFESDREDFAQGTSRGRGVYLGAYGYLEDLRPAPRPRARVEQPPDDYDEPIPLQEAPLNNAGFIHAASIRQATAAAILRTAHLTHATAANRGAMSVNLSSARVRRAEWYLEGMRMGQKVGALLGYQFERSLHDKELDIYLQAFRQRFPFEVDTNKPPPAGVPIEALAARNVVDGQKLVQAYQTGAFPYGVTELDTAPAAHRAAVQQLVKETAEALDAVADLALAEGVFQVSTGNHERAAAMLDAVNRGGIPPEAELVRTPRSGTSLAHVVGAVLPTAVPVDLNWVDGTPRAQTEPRLNSWVDGLLGDPADIRGRARIKGRANPATFTAAELNLSALDFLPVVGEDVAPGGELERRIVYALRRREGLGDATEITLDLIDPDPAWAPSVKTFFQVLPLVRALRRLASECRPLNADDLIAPYSPVTVDEDRRRVDIVELQTRADAAQLRLQATRDKLENAHNGGLPADVEQLRLALIDAAAFGLPDFPANASGGDAGSIQALSDQAGSALKALALRSEATRQAVAAAGAIHAAEVDERANAVRTIINAVFGGTLNVLPLFTPHNAPELAQSLAARGDLLKDAPPLAADTWLHGLTRVRPRIARVEELRLFAGMFDTAGDSLSLTIMQTPHAPGSRWLALPLEKIPLERGSVRALALMLPQDYDPAGAQCGLLFDDWVEVIPGTEETTGIAVHFDQPNAEPPQTLLLALAPHLGGEWRWDDLVATVLETFELAKERAVDTDQIDTTSWAQMLPALVMPVTPKNTTASLNLLKNAMYSVVRNP